MNQIDSISLNRLLETTDLIRVGSGWAIAPNRESGELFSPACSAKFAYAFDGFEVLPQERGVSAVVLRPPNLAMRFEQGQWVETSEPVFYRCDQLRQYLRYWAGPIRFRLRLERLPSEAIVAPIQIQNPLGSATAPFVVQIPDTIAASSPIVEEIRVGFSVPGEMAEYLYKFALPTRLSTPVRLSRPLLVSASGQRVPFPADFAVERLAPPFIVITPERLPVIGELGSDGINFTPPFPPNSYVVLDFGYVPLVERAGDIYEVSEIPSIAFSLLEERNQQQMPVEEWVKVEQGDRRYSAAYRYDQVVELTAIAREDSDLEGILNSMMAIAFEPETAFLEALPWGWRVPIHFIGGAELSSSIRFMAGIKFVSFKIALGSLLRGMRSRIC